jgi:hypothetical protein
MDADVAWFVSVPTLALQVILVLQVTERVHDGCALRVHQLAHHLLPQGVEALTGVRPKGVVSQATLDVPYQPIRAATSRLKAALRISSTTPILSFVPSVLARRVIRSPRA